VAKLIVNPNTPGRREIPLSHSTVLTIGRDPSNDLVLPDGMVSRRHAVVEHRAGRFLLRDCNSANGSVVNGDRVGERGLRDGDMVAIGSVRLQFREDMLEAGSGKVVRHPSAQPLRCSCGAEYRRGDLFCRECGAQVAQPAGPPKAVCPACATTVALPARFCSACGTPLAADGGRVEEPEVRDTRPVQLEPEPAGLAPPASPLSSGSMAIARRPLADRREALAPAGRPTRQPRPTAGVAPTSGITPRPGGRASAGSRLAAALVDAVFIASGQLVMLAPVGWYWWAREAPRTPGDVSFLPVLATLTLLPLALLLGGLYHVYFWSVKGATPGKELLGLRVETEDGGSPIGTGRAALRLFGYVLGLASLGVGFLMIAFGGTLHDRLAGTRVVVARR
jgi:uncharacterized RDD family membrane protein YckC